MGHSLVVAALDSWIQAVASLLPESRVVALLLAVIVDLKLAVPPFTFPLDFMFSQGEGCCCVQVTLEADQVTHTIQVSAQETNSR